MLRTAQWAAESTGGSLVGQSDAVFSTVVTDSRDVVPGAAYIARVGETSDGHTYIPSAVERGASLIVCEREIPDLAIPQVVVEDSTLALAAMARTHIAELRATGILEVIAVTGSAGKTTTKDLLAQILGTQAPTVAPRLSFNNEVGLPLTCLEADTATRYLVLEMGASGPGQLRYLTDIVAPDIAIELMVGHAHLGGFGSVQGIADAKRELVEGLRPGGTAILNADDPYVRVMASSAPGPVRFFSATGNPDATYTATEATLSAEERASFVLTHHTETTHDSAPVTLNLVGAHHVHNALAAASACCELGMSVTDVAAALSQATAQSPHRMSLHTLNINGHSITLIDDSYNANSDSMRAALTSAASLRAGRPVIAVLGEMLELGEASQETHEQVGQWAADMGIHALIALGEDARHYLTPLHEDTTSMHVTAWDDALEATLKLVDGPCFILVKGSNGSGAWRVADAIIERGQAQ